MDDFVLFIEALVNGKDWKVFVQIPHNKWSKTICEALAYGGLWPLFGDKAKGITCEEVKMPPPYHTRFFGLATIQGIRTKEGVMENDVEIKVQLPRMKGGEEAQCFYEMVNQGLGYFLGPTIKKIHVLRAGETIPQAHEKDRIILA